MSDTGVTERPEAAQQVSLSDAIAATFRAKHAKQDYASALARLAQALCNAQSGHLIVSGPNETLRDLATEQPVTDEVGKAAHSLLSGSGPEIERHKSVIVARVALPDASQGVLAVTLMRGEGVLQSLAHERLTMLSHHSYAAYDQRSTKDHQRLASAVARGDPKEIADALAAAADADYVAIGKWDGHDLGDIVVSGQTGLTNRAILTETLRATLREAVQTGRSGPETAFLPDANGTTGLAVRVEAAGIRPEQAQLLLRGIASAGDLAAPKSQKSPWRNRAIAGLVVLGLCAIPLPDGVDIPAKIAATEARVVTTPLSAVLDTVNVTHSDTVIAGETVLAEMDTTDILNRLIAAQAEYARAVLEQETARTQRNAAELRLAELEVARLDAEIALHESERDRGTLVAPISGIVIATGLAQQQGTMLRQGEILMEIANLDALRLDLLIPDEAIADLKPGIAGTFRPDFDPTRRVETEITAVSPAVSETLEVPVFPGRASIDADTTGLSPGMTGVMSVDRSLRPAGLIVWESLRDWFLLRVWP